MAVWVPHVFDEHIGQLKPGVPTDIVPFQAQRECTPSRFFSEEPLPSDKIVLVKKKSEGHRPYGGDLFTMTGQEYRQIAPLFAEQPGVIPDYKAAAIEALEVLQLTNAAGSTRRGTQHFHTELQDSAQPTEIMLWEGLLEGKWGELGIPRVDWEKKQDLLEKWPDKYLSDLAKIPRPSPPLKAPPKKAPRRTATIKPRMRLHKKKSKKSKKKPTVAQGIRTDQQRKASSRARYKHKNKRVAVVGEWLASQPRTDPTSEGRKRRRALPLRIQNINVIQGSEESSGDSDEGSSVFSFCGDIMDKYDLPHPNSDLGKKLHSPSTYIGNTTCVDVSLDLVLYTKKTFQTVLPGLTSFGPRDHVQLYVDRSGGIVPVDIKQDTKGGGPFQARRAQQQLVTIMDPAHGIEECEKTMVAESGPLLTAFGETNGGLTRHEGEEGLFFQDKQRALRYTMLCPLIHLNRDSLEVNTVRRKFVEAIVRKPHVKKTTRVVAVHWLNEDCKPPTKRRRRAYSPAATVTPEPLFWLFFPDLKERTELALIVFATPGCKQVAVHQFLSKLV